MDFGTVTINQLKKMLQKFNRQMGDRNGNVPIEPTVEIAAEACPSERCNLTLCFAACLSKTSFCSFCLIIDCCVTIYIVK